MLTAKESSLDADEITMTCPWCEDEYLSWCAWKTNEIVEREKECACDIDLRAERETIAEFRNPQGLEPAPGYLEMLERCDYNDNFEDAA